MKNTASSPRKRIAYWIGFWCDGGMRALLVFALVLLPTLSVKAAMASASPVPVPPPLEITTPTKLHKLSKNGGTQIDHQLLSWKVPEGWDVSVPNDKDIELKNKTTTISLFLSNGAPANILDLEQTRMKLDKEKKMSREHWNGQTWLVATFEKKDAKAGALQAVTFATAQLKGNLFSALALTPRDHPDLDITKVLSTIELKP